MQAHTNIIREAFDHSIPKVEKLDELIHSYGEEALEQLLLALDDENALFRSMTLIYLGRMADPRAVAPLIGFLHDQSRYDHYPRRQMSLRERVWRYLSPWMRRIHQQILRDERTLDLCGASRALGKLGSTDAVEALECLCTDSEKKVRITAKEALAQIAASSSS